MSRSVKGLDETKNKKHFNPEEDQIIRDMVAGKGPNCWNEIAGILNRTPQSIRNRYNLFLNRSSSKEQWSIEEDNSLIYLSNGPFYRKWAKLESFFPGRTQIQIKNRYNLLIRRLSHQEASTDSNSFHQDHNTDALLNMLSLTQSSLNQQDCVENIPDSFQQISSFYDQSFPTQDEQNLHIFDQPIPNPAPNLDPALYTPFDESENIFDGENNYDEYFGSDAQIIPFDCFTLQDDHQSFLYDDFNQEDELQNMTSEYQLIPSPFDQDQQIKTEQAPFFINEAIQEALDGPYCQSFPTYNPLAEIDFQLDHRYNFAEDDETDCQLFSCDITAGLDQNQEFGSWFN
jgi:hypothetical protein